MEADEKGRLFVKNDTDPDDPTIASKIFIIDCDTLQTIDVVQFNGDISHHTVVGEYIYVVTSQSVYMYDMETKENIDICIPAWKAD